MKEKVVMMTGTYAMGAPWLQFGQRCGSNAENGPDKLAEAILTLMTSGHGRRQHPFAAWNMDNGPAVHAAVGHRRPWLAGDEGPPW